MKLENVLTKIDQVGYRRDMNNSDVQALKEAMKHLAAKPISVEDARPLFEAKMKMIEEKTGRNVMTGLIMKAGPNDAKILYEQMFMCFYSGLTLITY